ncbi:MAG: hypothetical protein J0H04_06740, partial [Hyphomicrobium denitrificans]|nr:hypothetical protein [Hyphomicrobium denitrificans]
GMGMIGKAFGQQLTGLIKYNCKVIDIKQDARGVTATYIDALLYGPNSLFHQDPGRFKTTIADRVVAFGRMGFKLARIRHELPCDGIGRVVGIDKIGDGGRDGDGVPRADFVQGVARGSWRKLRRDQVVDRRQFSWRAGHRLGCCSGHCAVP